MTSSASAAETAFSGRSERNHRPKADLPVRLRIERPPLLARLGNSDADDRVGLVLPDCEHSAEVFATLPAEPVHVVLGERLGVDREDASHFVEEHVDDLFALARCKAFESWV